MAEQFIKVEGLGNDFLLLWRPKARAADLRAEIDLLRVQAPNLCDRRRGVGADGILLVCAASDARHAADMIVVNADGSRPEMCGNGLRCAALVAANELGCAEMTLGSDAGPRQCRVMGRDGPRWASICAEMGEVEVQGELFPAAGKGLGFWQVGVGNPHAVCFPPHGKLRQLAETLGPAIERDSGFPGGSNVEFARREPDGSLRVWVWERGCGITEACGTGAVATAAAAHHLGIASEQVTVHLPGGTLQVHLRHDPLRAEVQGPARIVFEGLLP